MNIRKEKDLKGRTWYIGYSKQPSVKNPFIKLTELMLPYFLSITHSIEDGRLVRR